MAKTRSREVVKVGGSGRPNLLDSGRPPDPTKMPGSPSYVGALQSSRKGLFNIHVGSGKPQTTKWSQCEDGNGEKGNVGSGMSGETLVGNFNSFPGSSSSGGLTAADKKKLEAHKEDELGSEERTKIDWDVNMLDTDKSLGKGNPRGDEKVRNGILTVKKGTNPLFEQDESFGGKTEKGKGRREEETRKERESTTNVVTVVVDEELKEAEIWLQKHTIIGHINGLHPSVTVIEDW